MGLVRVQALLGHIHLLCFNVLLQLGRQAVTPGGSKLVHSGTAGLHSKALWRFKSWR